MHLTKGKEKATFKLFPRLHATTPLASHDANGEFTHAVLPQRTFRLGRHARRESPDASLCGPYVSDAGASKWVLDALGQHDDIDKAVARYAGTRHRHGRLCLQGDVEAPHDGTNYRTTSSSSNWITALPRNTENAVRGRD